MNYYLIIAFFASMGFIMDCSCEVMRSSNLGNSSHPDKDMYVIHATVYEVGILTNKTDNKASHFNTTGTQESITFYQTNGSHIDLGGIPKPLLTNVTAQSVVGVAPVENATTDIWDTSLSQLSPMPARPMARTDKTTNGDRKLAADGESTRFLRKLFKRDINSTAPVKLVKGTAVIPPAIGLQSISLPPLLSLNNKLSGIPVPIPNTAIVDYAQINTLVRTP